VIKGVGWVDLEAPIYGVVPYEGNCNGPFNQNPKQYIYCLSEVFGKI